MSPVSAPNIFFATGVAGCDIRSARGMDVRERQGRSDRRGYDAAIGAGELKPGMVLSRPETPARRSRLRPRITCAGRPRHKPADRGFRWHSHALDKYRPLAQWTMRNAAGDDAGRVGRHDRVQRPGLDRTCRFGRRRRDHLHAGCCRISGRRLYRLLPDWYVDLGAVSLYYANRTLLPVRPACSSTL